MKTNVLSFIMNELMISAFLCMIIILLIQFILYVVRVIEVIDWSITMQVCLLLSILHTCWKLSHITFILEEVDEEDL